MTTTLPETFHVERLTVQVYPSRAAMGAAAADAAAAEIHRLVETRGRAVGLFASAASQADMLAALVAIPGIPWERLTIFHLDEYLGMDAAAPQSFRRFLQERLLSKVPVGRFHGLRGEAPDAAAECARYTALLDADPPDFAMLGIGENGHLAFNDPPVADFDDPQAVKIVELDEVCRLQQVHDGAFGSLEQVPRRALTLTVRRIVETPRLMVMVPGTRKREAVCAALEGPVTTLCPASILRTHPDARLYLDELARP
jgi:glucosamine-6-phosphate deaminase